MVRANKLDAVNSAIAFRLHGGHYWRGVGEPGRCADAHEHLDC
jgi:hypothetical protein